MYPTLKLFCPVLVIFSFSWLTQAQVQLGFGHYLEPVLKRTETGNGTLLRNGDILIQLKCMAKYPTEWIFSVDNRKQNYAKMLRNEWTDRKFRNSIQEATYDYTAWIQVQFSTMVSMETFICQAVGGDQDSIIVQLKPKTDTVEITTKVIDSTPQPIEPTEAPSTCDFLFSFMYVEEFGYYARCSSTLAPDSVIAVDDYDCPYSAAYCANTFRAVKMLQNSCTELHIGNPQRLNETGWTKIGGKDKSVLIPGTVVCSIQGKRSAQEYFFSAPTEIPGKRNIHFSWDEIQPNEMVWTNPPKFDPKYFTGHSLSIACTVPKYGFSFDPVLVVRINGTTYLEDGSFTEDQKERTWTMTYEAKLDKRGVYEIKCLGPVWNTTEWAGKSIGFVVTDPIPPHFDKVTEKFEFTEGATGKEILCEALGDPNPNVEWIVGNTLPNIKVKGQTLTFLTVTGMVQGEYTCKATNNLGQTATKTISVIVKKQNPTDIAGIAVGVSVGIVILVFAGLVYFYVKFKKLNNIISGLTMAEILEFREGKRKNPNELKTSADFIESLAYDNAYELPKSKFVVDTSRPLGSGAFGIVYKGRVQTEAGEIEAAFKTIKKEADISYVKSLLSELKILIHLGHHESIVNLIGAWTENIKHRELFVAVELCQYCLSNFLRENSSAFLSYVKNGKMLTQPILSDSAYHNIIYSRNFSTFTLVKWATEIASALEYISTKHIIHGDIAARNILLSFDLEAKLCDFGLAKQLVDYNYIKSEQCPLPWKWMAIESLRQMNFSTKSDVWAYGITLWEMFTLGDIPYPGLNWSTDFVDQLERGLRLKQPGYCPNEIWELMILCWQNNPDSRPSFKVLRESLETFQKQDNHGRI